MAQYVERIPDAEERPISNVSQANRLLRAANANAKIGRLNVAALKLKDAADFLATNEGIGFEELLIASRVAMWRSPSTSLRLLVVAEANARNDDALNVRSIKFTVLAGQFAELADSRQRAGGRTRIRRLR